MIVTSGAKVVGFGMVIEEERYVTKRVLEKSLK